MKVGIWDVDSTIPNLAIMRLSAWHKAQGHDVRWYSPLFADDYDIAYASKVFATSSRDGLDPEKIQIGGTGWDMRVSLPDEVEAMTPDYSIYGYPHNIGFTMRGCRLRCSFCVVPEKEGRPVSASTIDEIWSQRDSDFVMLLDNDFFGNPEWPDRIAEIRAHNLRVCFSQGLNIRNIKPDQAGAVASVRFSNMNATKRQVHFAWDDPRHEKLIHKGIATCVESGIRPSEMAFYVLIGYHSTPEEDLHRVMTLRDYGCDPYVMPYDKSDRYQRQFQRWVNHRAIFRTTSWTDYNGSIKGRADRNTIPLFDVTA